MIYQRGQYVRVYPARLPILYDSTFSQRHPRDGPPVMGCVVVHNMYVQVMIDGIEWHFRPDEIEPCNPEDPT